MKILGLSIVLIPTVLAASGGSDASALTNIDSPQSILGHDRDHRRKIKVTMERTVDDDSTNGYNAKTVRKSAAIKPKRKCNFINSRINLQIKRF